MSTRINKPWRPLTEEVLSKLPAQLGVYQLSSDGETIDYMGFAGGNSLFGLHGELMSKLEQFPYFRVEVTTAYLTRFRELLMVYESDHGCLPNTDQMVPGLGKLSPMGEER